MGVSFQTLLRRRVDVLMRRLCNVLLRRRYDVPIRRRGDVSLRRLGDVPSRHRWVFHLGRTKRIWDIRNSFLAFKFNALFTNCISNINDVLIDNAEDLDVVMPMYNLLEYSKNYRKTTVSLWNYYRDEPSDFPANNCNGNAVTSSASFKHKVSITGKTSNANQENSENTDQGNTKTKKNLEIAVP